MIKRIIEYFKIQKAKARIKKIIKLVYFIIFSEKYNLSTDDGIENFKKDFEENSKNHIEILQAYSIINPILYNQTPIEEIENYQRISGINFIDLLNKIQIENRNEEILKMELEVEEA